MTPWVPSPPIRSSPAAVVVAPSIAASTSSESGTVVDRKRFLHVAPPGSRPGPGPIQGSQFPKGLARWEVIPKYSNAGR
jgi:hypothetical protein